MPTKTLYVSDSDARLWTRAAEVASRRGRSMSEHICHLIRQDLIKDKISRPACPAVKPLCTVPDPHQVGEQGCGLKLADD